MRLMSEREFHEHIQGFLADDNSRSRRAKLMRAVFQYAMENVQAIADLCGETKETAQTEITKLYMKQNSAA